MDDADKKFAWSKIECTRKAILYGWPDQDEWAEHETMCLALFDLNERVKAQDAKIAQLEASFAALTHYGEVKP